MKGSKVWSTVLFVVCSEYRLGSTGRAAKFGRYEPKRGDVATPGWDKGANAECEWCGEAIRMGEHG
jgi:hypothetical protein